MLDKKELIQTLTGVKSKDKILSLLLDNMLNQSEIARKVGVTRQYVALVYKANKIHIDLWRAAHDPIKTM